MCMQPRSYQIDALNAIRSLYIKGIKRVLLHLATGAGKTFTFCTMLKQAYEKGTPSLVVVRGVKLIEQASLRLQAEGVPHGIYQGSNSRGHHHIIQVCSIDTLYRKRIAPPANFVVIDEAHQTAGEGYKWLLQHYAHSFILGVSATPHLQKGLHHIADAVVYPISILELMLAKFLVSPKYYGCDNPDLSGVQIQKGEFNEKQLEIVMRKNAIKGNIPAHYRKYADGRPTLMYCCTIAHSKLIVAQLKDTGIPALHIDAQSPDHIRQAAIDDLTAGRIKILSNVGVLTTGFDCPPVSCIILARPTMSYNLHIQIIGRGTRPYPGKDDFIVLDHAGNCLRHGPIEDEQPASLDARPKKQGPPPAERMTVCHACDFMYNPSCNACPACGRENPNAPDRNPKIEDGNLIELFSENVDRYFNRLKLIAKQRSYKKWWIMHQLTTKFGEELAQKYQQKIYKMHQWPITPIPSSLEPLNVALNKEWTAVFGSTIPVQPDVEINSSNSDTKAHPTSSDLQVMVNF